MDVDAENFEDGFKKFQEALPNAAFVAMDLEMTGISLGQEFQDDSRDLPEQRYTKKREIASTYGIIQVGLCLFEETLDEGTGGAGYLYRPFNFFIFPRPVNEPPDCQITQKMSIDADAAHFCRAHNIDFGRWLSKGVPYLDRYGEEKLRDAMLKRVNFATGAKVELSAREEAQVKRFLGEMGEIFAPNASIELPTNIKVQRAILEQVSATRSGEYIVLERRPGPLGGCREPQATLRNLGKSIEAKNAWEKEEKKRVDEFIDEQVGFRRIWKLLMKASKPLIFHNGMVDLLMATQWLEESLPETYTEFDGLLKRTLKNSRVYDTKWIASYLGSSKRLGSNSTALEALCRGLDNLAPGELPIFTAAKGFEKYEENMGTLHEAGFDAYATGRLFAYFRGAEGGSVGGADLHGTVATVTKGGGSGKKATTGPHKTQVTNRFANLNDTDSDEEEDEESSEEEEEEKEVTPQKKSQKKAEGGPTGTRGIPTAPNLATAVDKLYLMHSVWDFSWGAGNKNEDGSFRAPVQYTYEGRRVACQFLYGLKGIMKNELQKLLESASQQLASKDKKMPDLQVKWCNSAAAVAFLAPKQRADEEWQDQGKLVKRLQAILQAAHDEANKGDKENQQEEEKEEKKEPAGNKKTKGTSKSKLEPKQAWVPGNVVFEWGKDRNALAACLA